MFTRQQNRISLSLCLIWLFSCPISRAGKPEFDLVKSALNADTDKKNTHSQMDRRYLAQPAAMQEAVVLRAEPETVYRLLFLRAFGEPICVRLNIHPNGTATLFVKRSLDVTEEQVGKSQSGVDNCRLIVTEKTVSPAETKHFLKTIATFNFWHLPAIDCD
jgi:hypothetical protein